MDSLKLKKQLKNLSEAIKLDEQVSKEMRAVLLSKIEADVATEGRTKPSLSPIISLLTPSVRAIIVSLIVILIPGSGFTTVKAALSSLPGDFLYPVKITTEKIQVALINDENEKTQLRVQFAKRRLQEAEEIINKKEENGEKQFKVELAVQKFKEEIENISINLENINDEQKAEVEGKIALLNNEAEKFAQVVVDDNQDNQQDNQEEVLTEKNNTEEVAGLEEQDVLNSVVAAPVASVVEEPIDDEESFKIQLQIIKE